jgi:hypothetical protein
MISVERVATSDVAQVHALDDPKSLHVLFL